jgi:hypothetical protein
MIGGACVVAAARSQDQGEKTRQNGSCRSVSHVANMQLTGQFLPPLQFLLVAVLDVRSVMRSDHTTRQ